MLYLDRATTTAALPPLDEQLGLAERALLAVGGESQVPGKASVQPRPLSSVAYAMPAYVVDGQAPSPALGMKWVTVVPENSSHGLPSVNSLIILNDPETLAPAAVMDGSAITASRTAAVSGVVVGRLTPAVGERPLRVSILGAGVQARSHTPVLGHVVPGLELRIFDRHPERAATLADFGSRTAGVGSATVAPTARAAVAAADVVVTLASFGPDRQVMTTDWLRDDALVVAVDYEMYASAELAASAAMFLVDEPEGFARVRAEGRFDNFPDPTDTIGGYIRSGRRRPAGRILVAHLGMGLTDVIFAAAVLDKARALGLGVELPPLSPLPAEPGLL